jgi:hypothetical protein
MIGLLAFVAVAATTAGPRPLLGEKVALAGWRVAENGPKCAPLAIASDGGVPGSPRLADFAGGWGVAFDSVRTRSAFGFAGAGMLPQDKESDAAKRKALAKQWPYTRNVGRTGMLPRGSFAGYGLEGARRYSRANPRGLRQYSLAYLHVPGQSCLYNVWSRVSRVHLEKVLDSLRLVPGPLPPPPSGTERNFAPWIARLRAPATHLCQIDSKPAVACRLNRDASGALELRTMGREPLLVRVDLDRVSAFAISGGKRVPIFSDYVPHPTALPCLWSNAPPHAARMICVE